MKTEKGGLGKAFVSYGFMHVLICYVGKLRFPTCCDLDEGLLECIRSQSQIPCKIHSQGQVPRSETMDPAQQRQCFCSILASG